MDVLECPFAATAGTLILTKHIKAKQYICYDTRKLNGSQPKIFSFGLGFDRILDVSLGCHIRNCGNRRVAI